MKRILLKFANWIFVRYGHKYVPVSDTIQGYVRTAVVEVDRLEPMPQPGEWKRHQAYARLLKVYPDAERDELAFALELAVRRLKGKAAG